MVLIVGGVGQGKLAYALEHTGLGAGDVFTRPGDGNGKAIFNHLETWVRETLARGEDPQAALEPLLAANPNLILLCDEVGCGVVPMDRGERQWREAVGRLCCLLAQRAGTVIRMFCGLPTALKGELTWT